MAAAIGLALAVPALAHAGGGSEAKRPGQAGPVAGASIIGGGAADPARWPFAAAILREGRLHCGGSVIAPTKVLTAAHCVLGFDRSSLRVATGRTRLAESTAGQMSPVVGAAIHPDYRTTLRHDVAVLTLASPSTATPIALPSPADAAAFTTPGRQLRVSGWGARNPFGGSLAKILMKTTEKIRTNRRCKRVYRSVFSGKAMICAYGRRLRRFKWISIHTTGCSGDSGGALVGDSPTGPVAIGLVSYGSFICGFGGTPTVYARVSDALDFIQSEL